MPAQTPDPKAAVEPVRIGVIGRPHGVRGALKLHLDNPGSQTLRPGLVVFLTLPGKAQTPRTIKAFSPGSSVLELDNLTDRDQAALLTHAVVAVERADFLPEDDDEAYLVDLLGLPVVHKGSGLSLGTLAQFDDTGAQLLARVRPPGGTPADDVLVPFVPPIFAGVSKGVVQLLPPAGLFDEDALVAGSPEAETADASATGASKKANASKAPSKNATGKARNNKTAPESGS